MTFTMCIMMFYTFPHWNVLVVEEIKQAGGNVWLIIFLFLTHAVNNAVHNASWFVVCELEGSVSTGLLMGVKAAGLFIASAICFCDDDHSEQCMTVAKSFAVFIVMVGTMVYYWPEFVEGKSAVPAVCRCHC